MTMAAPVATPQPMSLRVPMRAEHITKVFPGTTALDDVTFDVFEGRGQCARGRERRRQVDADEGPRGRRAADRRSHPRSTASRWSCPRVTDAAQHGVGIIFQELNLCTNLTVLDNLFLAQEITRGPAIDRAAQRKLALELFERLGQDIDPDELVGNLRIGQQQIVEIAKALTHDVRVLIMDEPTSALSQAEVEGLFRIIADLKARGVAIVYISHKLEELLQVGDRITVLRDGSDRGPRGDRRRGRGLDHRADGRPLAGLAVLAAPSTTSARRCSRSRT